MLKYLTRALSAFTPRSAYEREIEGRRTYFRQEQATIRAHRAKVRAALDSGDRKAALFLAQPGAAVSSTRSEREQRIAAFCREDDELLEKVDRNLARSRSEIAAQQAELAKLGHCEVQVNFLQNADATKYRKLVDADQFRAANEFLTERIASGYAVKTELPQ
jgi:hypothetical protein